MSRNAGSQDFTLYDSNYVIPGLTGVTRARIFTAEQTITGYIRSGIYANFSHQPVYYVLQLFDLTKEYGSGNEPATVAEFRKTHPFKIYGYNILEEDRLLDTSIF